MGILEFLGIKKKIESFRTSEVFRTSGVPIHTFVERTQLELQIEDSLDAHDKALFFLGYSKSGKTVYRKKLIEDKKPNKVVFRCNNSSQISELYDFIASELQLGQIITSAQNDGGKWAVSSTGTVGKKDVASVSSSISSEVSYSYIETKEHTKVRVDVNFLCTRIDKKRDLIIILEDYHLVDSEFNRTLSEDLKHFQDEEILFLLIGIPSAPNRALKNNPDLSGRINYINFDYLLKEEIKEIISKGGLKLNVKFGEDVIDEIINVSLKNAFLVQNICKELVLGKGIKETTPKTVTITEKMDVKEACEKIASSLDSDYLEIYNTITSGARKQQKNKAFNQYEEIVKAIQNFEIEELEKGISYTDISHWSWSQFTPGVIQKFIDNGTYQSEASFKGALTNQILQAVERINSNIEKNSVRPILYVDDKKVYLMDLIFKFYLNWKNGD
ncbi:hypothetical protein WJR50_04455 [Catalinimonas sp. 4WD22]|uniref:hypothetical protein n=1 Tax=Catalinimonas locisalis TaxID=3133978 RepID=UPI003101837C